MCLCIYLSLNYLLNHLIGFIFLFVLIYFLLLLIFLFIHPSIHPPIHPSIHSFMHSFIHSFIHSVIHSFIHFFIDCFICLCISSFWIVYLSVFVFVFQNLFFYLFIELSIYWITRKGAATTPSTLFLCLSYRSMPVLPMSWSGLPPQLLPYRASSANITSKSGNLPNFHVYLIGSGKCWKRARKRKHRNYISLNVIELKVKIFYTRFERNLFWPPHSAASMVPVWQLVCAL